MLFKEEVLSWFKDLESYKRIDVLYNLINMCVPFELRFLGTCVEEIGKLTFQELRGPALSANDLERVSKDTTLNQDILEERARHRVLLYLSLLSNKNYSVANWMYKKLLRTDCVNELVNGNVKDEQLSEFLLLYTMALYHPAFNFDQKQYFGSILKKLFDLSENKNRISPKPSAYGYPPGFGYPTIKKSMPEMSNIPVKTAPTLSYSDNILHQQPPTLPHLPPQQPSLIPTIWNRPGFPCAGAPEMAPFPAPSISPLVSQQGSPAHSRNASPHRTQVMRHIPPPTQMAVAPPPPECGHPITMPPQPPIPMDPLPQSSLPTVYNTDIKLSEDELGPVPEDKPIWHHPQFIADMKPNGMRIPPFPTAGLPPFLVDQMQALNVDGENSLHQSTSSSNSSPNQTPPDTPSNTPSVTPHGPGRGDKPRNGIQYGPICDATSPPPPPYTNCTVPYYAQYPPNRSIISYNHTFRPQYTAGGPYPQPQPAPQYTTENSFNNYPTSAPYPYISVYSSQYLHRTPPGCYNCGAPNHVGNECSLQNIEDIIQSKGYQLDFSQSQLPDTDK